jgi:hypothetical protein
MGFIFQNIPTVLKSNSFKICTCCKLIFIILFILLYLCTFFVYFDNKKLHVLILTIVSDNFVWLSHRIISVRCLFFFLQKGEDCTSSVLQVSDHGSSSMNCGQGREFYENEVFSFFNFSFFKIFYFFIFFIYSHVHTLFGSFFHPVLSPTLFCHYH